MKKVYIFGNSVAYLSYSFEGKDTEANYTEMISKETPVQGYYFNGLTILDIRQLISNMVMGKGGFNKVYVIIHVGIECVSHATANFIYNGLAQLQRFGYSPHFQTFIVPKLLDASKCLTHDYKDRFFSLLTPAEFDFLYREVMWLLEGCHVILMGMSKPNIQDKPYFTEQALVIDNIIRKIAHDYSYSFIDVWNWYPQYVADSCHLTEEGHREIFEQLKTIIK